VPNFYCHPEEVKADHLLLLEEEARHITRVLRHKPGDIIVAVDGLGNEFTVLIKRASESAVEGEIVKKRRKVNEPISKITLALAIPKNHRMDWVVEKSTELGVNRIIPIVTERTVVLPEPSAEGRLARWQRIAISAMKQSGRTILPKIESITHYEDLLDDRADYDLAIIAWEEEKKRTLRDLFQNIVKPFSKVLVIIGPEGGFSKEEIGEAERRRIYPVSLGPRKLRVETAGIVLLSLLLHELGELA